MSLFGALSSGVSGLSAQSSALGAIADNVTNVNTIGYKSTDVQFKTLVTKQVSSTKYSPGGVQSAPKSGVDVQGLLQSSTSATDVAISGQGFFIVNEQPEASLGSLFAYTRAGSFSVDKDGYLQNTSGWYLQGWPLQAAGNTTTGFTTVTDGDDTFLKAYQDSDGTTIAINDNIVSNDDLRPLNINTIGGTAQETKNIRLGANLPSGDAVGENHKSNVVIYDTLGNSNNLELQFDKVGENSWGMAMPTPSGAATLELHGVDDNDSTPDVFAASGLLEFTGVPADGEQIIIDGITFEFDTNDSVAQTPTLRKVDISASTINDASDITPILKTAIDNSALEETSRFADSGTDMIITQSTMGAGIAMDVSNILSVKQVAANGNSGTFTIAQIDYAYKNGARFDFENASAAASSSNSYDFNYAAGANTTTITATAGTFSGFSDGDAVIITGAEDAENNLNVTVNVNADGSVLTVIEDLSGAGYTNTPVDNTADTTMSILESYDTDTLTITAGSNTAQVMEFRAGPAAPQATVTNTFTVADAGATATADNITAAVAGTFYGFQAGDQVTISNGTLNDGTFTIASISADGTVLTFTDGDLTTDGADTDMTITRVEPSNTNYVTIPAGASASDVATALATEIATVSSITTPTRFTADGSSLIFAQSAVGNDVVFNVADITEIATVYAIPATAAEGTAAAGTNFTVSSSSYGEKKAGIDFNGDGSPATFNANNIDIQWANGANDQEFTSTSDDTRIGLFLGNENVSDGGMTQLAGDYQINFISQNGAQFGNFAGVSVGEDGIVTALFDNGVTRPVFMIPVATFVNPNRMDSLTGNVYVETDFSGQPTVREAGEGGAGQLTGAALESSTVDLGEEFTSMIVTQRAYSAAAKIITTADEMLDELLRIK